MIEFDGNLNDENLDYYESIPSFPANELEPNYAGDIEEKLNRAYELETKAIMYFNEEKFHEALIEMKEAQSIRKEIYKPGDRRIIKGNKFLLEIAMEKLASRPIEQLTFEQFREKYPKEYESHKRTLKTYR